MAQVTFKKEDSLCEVWIVRHGERIDETEEGDAWYYKTPKPNRFDPPLTKVGQSQAQQAARMLQQLVLNHGVASNSEDPFFDTIYTSPMQRCLSTAHELSIILNQSPDQRFHSPNGVVVIPGLAECAAAARRDGVDNLAFLTPDMMTASYPSIQTLENCWHHGSPRTYQEALNWVVHHEIVRTQNVPRRSRILIVAHREAIRDLLGYSFKVPYCAIAAFHAILPPVQTKGKRSPSFDNMVRLNQLLEVGTQTNQNSDVDSFIDAVVEYDSNSDREENSKQKNRSVENNDHLNYEYQFENVFHPETGQVVPIVQY